jgi:hypothetical protein
MQTITRWLAVSSILTLFLAPPFGKADQTTRDENQTATQSTVNKQDHDKNGQSGAAREIGAGAGSVGIGAAKATGDAAKGGGEAVVDAATLHPINAAGAAGKGAATAGKDVTVGTAKGAGKITKGVGRVFKKIF